MYQNVNLAPSASFGNISTAANAAPREPNIGERLQEASKYLAELEQLQAQMRTSLYGPAPQEQGGQRPAPHSLETLAIELSQRAACLVGDMQNILKGL